MRVWLSYNTCVYSASLSDLPPRHCTARQTTGRLTIGERDDITCGLSHTQRKSLFVWLLSTYVYLQVQRHVRFIELLIANICRALVVTKTEVAARVSSVSAVSKCSLSGSEGTSVLSGFQTLHLHLHLHLSGTCYSHSALLNHMAKRACIQPRPSTCVHLSSHASIRVGLTN